MISSLPSDPPLSAADSPDGDKLSLRWRIFLQQAIFSHWNGSPCPKMQEFSNGCADEDILGYSDRVSLHLYMTQAKTRAVGTAESGLVWAPSRGRDQNCWPRQIYRPNWETRTPIVFLFSLLPSCEKTQSSRMRASKTSLPDIEYWALKCKGPSPRAEDAKARGFPCKPSLMGLLELSVGEVEGKLLFPAEGGRKLFKTKEIQN